MSITDHKITEQQIADYGLTSLPDMLIGTAGENKTEMQKLLVLIGIPAINAAIDELALVEAQADDWAVAEAARAAAELLRAAAEEVRATAEQGRTSAESSRVTAEQARASAEASRVNAESSRAAGENTRSGAETLRTQAELARTNAENLRAQAEGVRNNKESARSSAEYSRANAEDNRVAREFDRSRAEEQRVINENNRQNSFLTEVQQAQTARVGAQEAAVAAAQSETNAKQHEDSAKTAANSIQVYVGDNPPMDGSKLIQIVDIPNPKDFAAVNRGELDDAIDTRLPQPYETTTGYIATCTDANAGTCYPMIYGKSVQSGTPTPEAPIAVQSSLTEPWELRRSGKNVCGGDYLKALFLKTPNKYSAVTFDGKDCVRVDSISAMNYVFTSFKPSTQYTFIFNIYNNNPTTSSYFGYVMYSDGTSKYFPASPSKQWETVVLTSDAGKTVVGFGKGGYGSEGYYDIQNCGIFEGAATLADFNPYTAQTFQFTALSDGLPGIKLGATVPTSLQGRKGLWFDGTDWWIGNWMDADSGKQGVNVAKNIFTGISGEGMCTDATYSSGTTWRCFLDRFFPTNEEYGVGLCNYFPVSVSSWGLNRITWKGNPQASVGIDVSSLGLTISATKQEVLLAVNTWLQGLNAAGNPVTIYYVTATETISENPSDTISALRSLTTLDGTNNIMVDGSTVQPWLSVKYRQDLQKYVKDKLAAIQAAIISLGGNI